MCVVITKTKVCLSQKLSFKRKETKTKSLHQAITRVLVLLRNHFRAVCTQKQLSHIKNMYHYQIKTTRKFINLIHETAKCKLI